MFLFFDTETNGLPQDWSAPVTDVANWPRLVQIAWVYCNAEGEKVGSHEYIIKPEGFVISRQAANVHGITTKRALAEGVRARDHKECQHNTNGRRQYGPQERFLACFHQDALRRTGNPYLLQHCR